MKLGDNRIQKKCKRYDIPYHGHELTFGCCRGKPLLRSRLFCDYLVKAIRLAQKKHHFDLWAYVFMPEHVHLLIYPTQPTYSTSLILKSIKQSVARRAVNWLKVNQPGVLETLKTGQKYEKLRFWQDGGGYDRNIFSHKAAFNCVHYIHMNPVKRSLVESPDQWYYSSYRQMHQEETGPLEICLRHFQQR